MGEDAVEDSTDTGDVSLLRLHVDVDEPEIESLGVRVDDSLEDGTTALGVPELELELGELADDLDVCEGREEEVRKGREKVGKGRGQTVTLFKTLQAPGKELASFCWSAVGEVELGEERPDFGALAELLDGLLEELFLGL